MDARSTFSKALGKNSISPGSTSGALRSPLDLYGLTKPAGVQGHYSFDDPMFREWMGRLTWLSLPVSVRITSDS